MEFNQKFFKYFVYYPVVYSRGMRIPLYLKELIESQYFPVEKIKENQLCKLKKLVQYAKDFVPYHKETMANLSVEKLQSIDDLCILPFTTKTIVRECQKRLTTKKKIWILSKKTTGGSTGEPVTIWKTSNSMAREKAATWRGYSWAGIDIGDRQVRFWGIPFGLRDRYRAKVLDFLANRKRCSAFSFDEENFANYTNVISAFNPSYFYGYVSMLTEYAEYFMRIKKRPTITLKCVITTSELLTKYQRERLKKAFSCKVINEYGCGELGVIAHECEKGSMHITAENLIVEILDGERVCKAGEIGEIVITELNNFAMPLIRYRTGDYGSVSAKQCTCGRTLPILESLVGRAYDMIKNREGKTFHGEFFMYIIEEAKKRNLGVGGFQIIQLDCSNFKIRIKPEVGYGKHTEDFIVKKLRNGFDMTADVKFEKVNKIEREKSGKMRLIIGM